MCNVAIQISSVKTARRYAVIIVILLNNIPVYWQRVTVLNWTTISSIASTTGSIGWLVG
jgi:hypothetical protein